MFPDIEFRKSEVGGIQEVVAMNEGYDICKYANCETWFSLSKNQRALWFLYKLQPDLQGTYNVNFFARLLGEVDLHQLEKAIAVLASRHAALRTRFREFNSEPQQRIERFVKTQLRVVDVSGFEPSFLETLIKNDSKRAFDVTVASLFRVDLYKISAQESVILVTFDHLVVDGWSFWRLIEELGKILDVNGDIMPSKPCVSCGGELKPTYSCYVNWQREWLNDSGGIKQFSYWQKMLADQCPSLDLPVLAPSAVLPAKCRDFISFNLDAELSMRLSGLAVRSHVSLYVVLLTAYFILLRRLTGQDAFHVGSPMPARKGRKWSEVTGNFFNQVVLRADFYPDLTVGELLGIVRNRVRRAMENQDFPFSELVARLNPPREKSRSPFFQTMFVFQDARGSSDALNILVDDDDLAPVSWGGLHLAHFCRPPIAGAAALDLVMETVKCENKIVFALDFDSSLFERSTMERWMGHWRRLLATMVAEGAEDMAVDRLPLLSEAERQQVLTEWNATAADYPRDACVHELFEAQVARDPSAIAVVQGEVSLTYAELNARANRLAHYLRGLGVRPDDRVAICVQRSVEMVVAVLAVLKAGGAYVPLDPAYPPERLAYMHSDCGAVAVLTDAASRRLVECSATAAVIVDLQADSEHWTHLPDSNPDRHANGLTARHLAYVIYTSGSTGAPKGAMNEHRGVVNMACAQKQTLLLNPDSRVLQFASFSFDACTFEIMMAICWGGALFIPCRNQILAGDDFSEIIKKNEITNATLPPTVLPTVSNVEELVSLQTVVVAGEVLPAAMVKRWSQGRRLINAYGPTETAVCACVHECDASASGAPPIGRPIANVRIYILDAYGAPAPIGVVGELYIGGDGVGRGYLDRDDLTGTRFLADPFNTDPTVRMYRTGDLGRWRADGTIEFVGRNDYQIKIRGFRIELGEIEARLSAHADVRECVVVALEDATVSDKRLVAYWVGAEGVDAAPLRNWLSAVLPDYMVPAAYVQLDRLPLTPNGKLDRKALPAPDGTAYAAHAYEAPQGEIEQAIAAIWSELLGLETIGRHDNFFALGGHSLLAVTLIERMRQQDMKTDIENLLVTPTVFSLAEKTIILSENYKIKPSSSLSDADSTEEVII